MLAPSRRVDFPRECSLIDIRGLGLLLGVELVKDRNSRAAAHERARLTTKKCFEYGLSMNIRRRPERGSVWRIAPPLTVATDEIDRAIAILDKSLKEGLDELARRKAAWAKMSVSGLIS